MGRIFDMDNGVMRFMGRLADLVIMNILFIISCIPVFTIGAALSALYYTTAKQKKNEGYVISSYLKAFKSNFKQSTIIWLIMLVLGLVIAFDWRVSVMMTGKLRPLLQILLIVGSVFWLEEAIYVFPLTATFENTIKNTMSNALLLALANLPKTFCMMLITVAAAAISLWNSITIIYGLMIWILVGFALLTWINSSFLLKIFEKLIPAEQIEEEEN